MNKDSSKSKGLGAAARVTALASSVMDLHVRIALQEMDREKRRLISGGIFLATGGVLMLLALIGVHIIFGILIKENLNLKLESTLGLLAIIDIIIAGISLRIGGALAKGPYLPETLQGISKTTRAVLGK